jgi:hypothetical protein
MNEAQPADKAAAWAKGKAALLGDPEFQRLYREFDEAYDGDPADPRLERPADDAVALGRRGAGARRAGRVGLDAGRPPDPVLASGPPGTRSAAWERPSALSRDRAARG